jgi:hypothetical protein
MRLLTKNDVLSPCSIVAIFGHIYYIIRYKHLKMVMVLSICR